MKTEDYPEIPSIAFESASLLQTEGQDSLILIISFIDGDGNLGLDQGDTLPPFNPESPFYYNMFIEYFEEVNGEFKQVTPHIFSTDTIRFYYRFPVITPDTKVKAVKGTMQVLIPVQPLYSKHFMYKIQIADRALNLSNMIETPVFTQ